MADQTLKDELMRQLLERFDQANALLKELADIQVDGVFKLRKKAKQELKFLQRIHSSGNLQKDHLTCSNLKHLEALTNELRKNLNSCVAVMCTKILTEDNGNCKKLCVDLILHGGHVWVKVVARNPKALTLVSCGEGYYGQRSIVEHAEEFVRCSRQHVHFYKTPTVVFVFAYGIEAALSAELESVGVVVEGTRVDDDGDLEFGAIEMPQASLPEEAITVPDSVTNTRLNLCVTTMLAYVSALTNGGAGYQFESPLLTDCAKCERERPVKPILDQLFKDRELFCCVTAAGIFRDILETLGGPGEKRRGEELLNRVKIVDDVISTRLEPCGRIKQRGLATFGTGEALEAVTVTANQSFVRSALNQGVSFAVFLHESRALSEVEKDAFCVQNVRTHQMVVQGYARLWTIRQAHMALRIPMLSPKLCLSKSATELNYIYWVK